MRLALVILQGCELESLARVLFRICMPAHLKNIGYELTVCTDVFPEAGKKFADTYGCEFVHTYEELCRHPKVDYVDVCTFPDFRLQPIEICAQSKKHVQVQKPIAVSMETGLPSLTIAIYSAGSR